MAGGTFGGGDGTELTPYLVEDALDLDAVRNDLTAYYKQTANIDLNIAPYNEGEGWVPIGTFSGEYDGDNNTISNLYINASRTYIGLFSNIGQSDDYKLRNINLINVLITDTSTSGSCGGLIGRISCGVSNCTVTGSITGGQYTGGLAGHTGATFNNGKILQCSTNISIFTNNDNINGVYTGGLIGYQQNQTIQECYSIGNIESVNWRQNNQVGGLVGYSRALIDICYSTANTKGTLGVGGLAGYTMSTSDQTFFSKCFARGSVVITRTSDGGYASGLVGYRGRAIGVIQCYSANTITQEGGFTSATAGLVGGTAYTTNVTNSVYDSETSGQSDDDGRGIPKTTAEMKQQSTYTNLGWSF